MQIRLCPKCGPDWYVLLGEFHSSISTDSLSEFASVVAGLAAPHPAADATKDFSGHAWQRTHLHPITTELLVGDKRIYHRLFSMITRNRTYGWRAGFWRNSRESGMEIGLGAGSRVGLDPGRIDEVRRQSCFRLVGVALAVTRARQLGTVGIALIVRFSICLFCPSRQDGERLPCRRRAIHPQGRGRPWCGPRPCLLWPTQLYSAPWCGEDGHSGLRYVPER